MDRKNIDLNAPAFGSKAQQIDTSDEIITPAVAPVAAGQEGDASDEEEKKVPYSRFKKFHDAAKEAQEDAEKWRAEAERLRTERFERQDQQVNNGNSNTQTPQWWIDLYGNEPEKHRAYQIWEEHQPKYDPDAIRREAIEAVRQEQRSGEERVERNLDSIDDHLEEASAYAGHTLSSQEESDILDIIDEYTPKDRNGNYAGELLEPEKAWEIYELKQQAAGAPRKQSRDAVADLTGSRSNGETTVTSQGEQDKNFVPNWGNWRKRFEQQ